MALVWKRVQPGLYASGEYTVGQTSSGEWYAEGPGVDEVYRSKGDAQLACMWAQVDL